MYNPFRFFLSLLVFALVPSFAFGQFSTVKEERSYADPLTGDWITNGVITPLDQDMRNFYLRNADGAIEVILTEDAKIGLQSRVQKGGFEERKVKFEMGDLQLSLPLQPKVKHILAVAILRKNNRSDVRVDHEFSVHYFDNFTMRFKIPPLPSFASFAHEDLNEF
ncbi:MAG: hypothetical protein ISR34_10755 [Pirellulales bacterium]|nr:hypothetical protein [Pirellulales bacterium]